MVGVPGDDVLSLNKVIDELVQFNEMMSVGIDVNWKSFMIVLGSQVYTNNCVGNGFLALNVDLVFVWFMFKPLQETLDVQSSFVLLFLFVFADTFNSGVVEVDNVVLEVGNQVGEVDLLYLNSWQDNVIVLVGWERFLVALEQVDDVFQENVEGWVTSSRGGNFQ